jgi:type II secretory ATPase GspE/PulE/Tfp pilus assembly ATPase PilB-like protein
MDLSELGYSAKLSKIIQKLIHKPDGISLIVGPTGCGKTTTLYAILNSLKSIENKIIAIEDPVEIQMPLMTQVQINEKRGINFPQSVRAFLRHDPDIILIGEIRDQLTAQEALRAVMTGHQVFSTLHTNRAIDTFFRLHDLGLPFTYMADHLSMIISQRLVRKLCPACKRERKLEMQSYVNHKYLNTLDHNVFYAVGCGFCRGGYRGQTVVAEILIIDEKISDFLSSQDMVGLKKYVKDNNHLSMFDDARRLIESGITSIEEAQRILGS